MYEDKVLNPEDILSEFEHDELMHYGTPRHSGRYPYGSGDNPFQHEGYSHAEYKRLKSLGMSDNDIAKGFGMSTTEFRKARSLAKEQERDELRRQALKLKDHGYTNASIAEKLGLSGESQVRNLIKNDLAVRQKTSKDISEFLKQQVSEKGFIDVGAGVELSQQINVSDTKFKTSLQQLKDEGYHVYYLKTEQAGNLGKYTYVAVLAPPDATYKDLMQNSDKVQTIDKYDPVEGVARPIVYPKSIDRDRIMVRYGDEGGKDRDGLIQLRRGVEDISLGESSYAQVRIAVDGTHFMKGMAMYSEDIPDGYDVIYNTNKPTGSPDTKVFKELKPDPNNPFGASIKPVNGQRWYKDADGNEQLSVINKINDEGDWNEWSRTISAQMLSKQKMPLINRQLDLSYNTRKDEFDEIMSLTNPTVKAKMLIDFAENCDSNAVDLKAVAFPRQAAKVILPFPNMKETEIYAPDYNDGEKVCLIRYPHGGTFEIPTLTVNNKQPDIRSVLGNAPDAIGIHPIVAERLSGADFDGDTAVVIPTNNQVKIHTTKPLEGLKGFDTKEAYPYVPGMKLMTNKQNEMGRITNLITDMTLQGASPDELARAVRHSMVIIDSEKHKLNYTQSAIDNNIAELGIKYQGKATLGASTLISQSKGQYRVAAREDFVPYRDIDPATGEKVYREKKVTLDKYGVPINRTQKSTKMAETKDARTLSSGTPQEEAYAKYANRLKSLANEARKAYMAIEPVPYSASARAAYKDEVDSLNSKLRIALSNAPRERQAQLVTNSIMKQMKRDNPNMTNAEYKKQAARQLTVVRTRYGASKQKIDITPKEWEAIQSGAISSTKLGKILANANSDQVKKYALPRSSSSISPAREARIKSMSKAGYTMSEIAQQLGLSASKVNSVINPRQ